MEMFANAPRPGKEDAPGESAEAAAMLTVEAVAKQLKVSRSKVYALIQAGKLAAHRLPAIRVANQDLAEFLGTCRTDSPPIESIWTQPRQIKLKHLR